jgi:hypothetical protein
MKKKIIVGLVTALLIVCSVGTAFAQDSPLITFKGESEKFVESVTGDTSFTNMEPGETRTMNLTLKNEDASEMSFFMSAEILDNIAAATGTNGTAVYDFTLAKNGEVFFSTVIGDGKVNTSIGKEYLSSDNNILLDNLSQGQSDVITVTLALDGDSTNGTSTMSTGDTLNTSGYMNKEGQIQFVFSAATPVTPGGSVVQTITNYVNQNVNTGIGASVTGIVIGAILIAVAVILIVKRRKAGERS